MVEKMVLDQAPGLGLTAEALKAHFALARDEKALEGEYTFHLISLEARERTNQLVP